MQHLNDYKQKWFDYLGYKPHEGQRKLHFPTKDSARFFVMVCGRRFGKTTASAMEATFYASQPNKRIWLVGLSYDKADLMFREVWDKMVKGHPNDIIKASEKERYIKFKWDTVVEAKSADNPDSLVGEGLDLLIIDEAAKVRPRIWDMYLSPTLSDRKGKAVFISTPEGFNWLYDLYLLGKTDDLWESHQAPSWDNSFAFPDGQGDQFLVERKGICLKSFLSKSMEHSLHRLKEGFTLLIGILMLVTIPIISTFLLFVALILGTGCRLWDGIRHTE